MTHLLRNLSGSSPFTVDSSGFTPLHYAASSGHKMAIQMVREASYWSIALALASHMVKVTNQFDSLKMSCGSVERSCVVRVK